MSRLTTLNTKFDPKNLLRGANPMTVPGFTAEASIYRSAGSYMTAVGGLADNEGGSSVIAMYDLSDCGEKCRVQRGKCKEKAWGACYDVTRQNDWLGWFGIFFYVV